MHENEVPRIDYTPVKPTFFSFFKKIAVKLHLMQPELISTIGRVEKRVNVQPQTNTIMDKHGAMISMLNQGKKFDDAERIASVTTDYGIDLSALDADKIKVTGKSVWINLED